MWEGIILARKQNLEKEKFSLKDNYCAYNYSILYIFIQGIILFLFGLPFYVHFRFIYKIQKSL